MITCPVLYFCMQNLEFKRQDFLEKPFTCTGWLNTVEHSEEICAFRGRLVEETQSGKRSKAKIPELIYGRTIRPER